MGVVIGIIIGMTAARMAVARAPSPASAEGLMLLVRRIISAWYSRWRGISYPGIADGGNDLSGLASDSWTMSIVKDLGRSRP